MISIVYSVDLFIDTNVIHTYSMQKKSTYLFRFSPQKILWMTVSPADTVKTQWLIFQPVLQSTSFSPWLVEKRSDLHVSVKYKCYCFPRELRILQSYWLDVMFGSPYWWHENVKVAGNLDVKLRIYSPESLEQFDQKPIPLWHFLSPINQRVQIYQRTVVRDRWAEGWGGQRRFFTGPPRHSSSLTFSPLWIGLLLTGWAFNLFHIKRGGKKTQFAHKVLHWLINHMRCGFLVHFLC